MDQNTDAKKRVDEALKNGTNNMIMLCEYQHLPPMHQLIVEEVSLSINPPDGDVYLHPVAKKWCIHHQGKLKLAMAAGVEWDTVDTRPVTLQRDFVHFQAVGQIRREFGRIIKFRGDFEFDLESLREDLVNQYCAKADKDNKKGDDKERYVQYCVQRDYSQKRINRLKLAATGAKSVVIDKLLNLKAGYSTKDELGRPFMVVRCQMAPDLSDPAIAQRVNMMAIQAMVGIYGPAQLPAPNGGQYTPSDMADIIDLPHDDGQPPAFDDDFTPSSSAAPSFDELDRNAQIEVLSRLANEKNYDTSKLEIPILEMGDQTRKKFHGHLLSLP